MKKKSIAIILFILLIISVFKVLNPNLNISLLDILQFMGFITIFGIMIFDPFHEDKNKEK